MTSPRQSVDPTLLRESMARRFYSRLVVTGEMRLPAVPGMIAEYVAMCETVFASVGRAFSAEQIAHFKTQVADQLEQAYSASPRSSIVISIDAPLGTVLNYHIRPEWWTVEVEYENWIATREPPLFGAEPDARVWALANEAPDPGAHRVLDIGAGTGRNALALARRGFPVDAVELTAKFADTIRAEAQRESLDLRIIQRDVFATTDDLRRDYRLIVLSGVVSDFRSTQQLRGVFELAADCLAVSGRLVFNTFLPRGDYIPDRAARELGQQLYTSIFTRPEMSAAAAGLPLALVGDDSVYEYEKTHLPNGVWPPTGWYADWVSGRDLFDIDRADCPIELRWLVYQKAG